MKYVIDVANYPDRQTVHVEGQTAKLAGTDAEASLFPSNGTPVRVMKIGEKVVRIVTKPGERRGQFTLEIDGYTYSVDAMDERTRAIRDLTAKSAAASGPAPLKAPMPGLIVRVNVAVGDVVVAGQGLVVMEAMKMENELRTASAGTVKAILVETGKAVDKGTILVELE